VGGHLPAGPARCDSDLQRHPGQLLLRATRLLGESVRARPRRRDGSRAMRRLVRFGLVTGSVALAALGCGRDGAKPATAQPASPDDFVLPEGARGIATAPAQRTELADYLDLAARIQADPTRVVRVYAPVSGRLLSVEVRPADYVQQGQVLATLASADLAQAWAAYRQAQAYAQVKQQALQRSRALYEHHVIALRDYQQAQADAQSAAAAFGSARARLELLGADADSSAGRLEVRAPRAGVVTDLSAAPGEF